MATQHDLGRGTSAADRMGPWVTVVADDLIWASRLGAAVERAGATAVLAADGRVPPADEPATRSPAGAIVDLGLRRTDAVAVIQGLVASGIPVLAVGQHEDLLLRKRALAAGASRAYSYNKVFTDGPALIARWLRTLATAAS